ncbi:unnamed protein product [Caenorhabditis brenneri]
MHMMMTNNLIYSALIFSVFIEFGYGAINCYYGIDETAPSVHVSNIVKAQCPSDFFCYKQAKVEKQYKHYQYSYGCGTIQICSQPTCTTDDDGFKTCCCTTDYCNSSEKLQMILTLFFPLTSLSFCSKRTSLIVKRIGVPLSGWKIWAVINEEEMNVVVRNSEKGYYVLRVATYNSIPVGSTLKLQTIKMDGRPVDAANSGHDCLKTFWLNEETGFKKAINYVTDLFNIDCFSVHLQERGIWMIDWINTLPQNRVPIIWFQTFNKSETSKDDLAYVIQNSKTKELWVNGYLYNEWICTNNFENFNIVRIRFANNWFNVHNLMSMRCSEISTSYTDLTSQDINKFLKHWIQGGSSKLAWLAIRCDYRDIPTENIILAGIEGFCRKVENKRTILKDNSLMVPTLVCFDNLEIYRSDGMVAGINFVNTGEIYEFHMAVWHNIGAS